MTETELLAKITALADEAGRNGFMVERGVLLLLKGSILIGHSAELLHKGCEIAERDIGIIEVATGRVSWAKEI